MYIRVWEVLGFQRQASEYLVEEILQYGFVELEENIVEEKGEVDQRFGNDR